ncbi:hypothetical protein FRB91_008496 [Serendipita sp. 411]|nr:hypothetical protein FRB91_008496 [Serendipita sp. 411]
MTESAASRVLSLEELAENIIELSYNRDIWRETAIECKTLVALITVNRFLSRIALSRLWKIVTHDEMIHFIRIIVSSGTEETPNSNIQVLCGLYPDHEYRVLSA